MSELLPCPFCGGEAKFDVTNGGEWQVWCQHCSCIQMGSFYDTREEAIEAWNQRIEQAEKEGKNG